MRAVVLAILFSFTVTSVLSQNYYDKELASSFSMEAASVVTQSIRGTHVGLALNLTSKNHWQLSYIKISSFQGESGEDTFEGVRVLRYFYLGRGFQIGPALRVGYHNQYFLGVLPSIQTHYQLNDTLSLSAGIAKSDGFPHFNAALGFNIFSKK